MVGIISNFAASATQKNLNKANEAVTASISRLASGNKITSAKDDVAGLAVGTVLKTNISSLNAAVTNAGQATAMLGVMDGALENVSTILSRQKSLASQATSGSLDATSRGYLNQEFQNLADEINRIANNTEFNGLKLIDGSLNSGLTLAVTAAGPSQTVSVTPGTGYSETGTGSDVLTGAISFGSAFDNTSLHGTIPEISATYNSPTSSTFTMVIGAKTYTAANVNLTSLHTGGNNVALNLNSGTANDTITLTLDFAKFGAYADSAAFQSAVNDQNALNSVIVDKINLDTQNTEVTQTFTAAAANGGYTVSGAGTSQLRESIGLSLGSAFDSSSLLGLGSMPAITATQDAGATTVDFSIKIGSKTYTANNVEFNDYSSHVNGRDIEITLNSGTTNDSITLKLDRLKSAINTNPGAGTLSSANVATILASALPKINEDLSSVTFTQTKAVSTYSGTGTLASTKLNMTSTDFSTLSFSDIKVEEAGSGEYKLTIDANGKQYTATTTSSGQLAAGSNGSKDFTATDGSKLTFINGPTALNISGKTEQFIKDFKASLAAANGALDFQVGTEATNKIAISASGVKTANIYKDDAGAAQTIDITSQANAEVAGNVLDNAINSVIASRANIGALQSRFDYASENISSTIENMDAARSVFLDTDVALESSKLAKKQIQVQASISMLAKANSILEKLTELLR